jgi:predicted esterase
MLQSHAIVTPKTARVFTYGKLSPKTKLIWIVAHGYGFLAEYFIKKFEELNPEENFVIVPEALNRFYLKELSGRVGASWMTTEDRENEIKDYILYLENIYETLILQNEAKIVGLGFSQGAATIARWAMQTSKRLNQLVFWGGTIPNDCLNDIPKLNTFHPYLLVGDKDEFISEEKINEVMKSLSNNGLIFSHIFYKGGHAILTEPLLQLCSELTER